MTDIDSLAFSIYNNKGVFALLLGSGTSKAAGIPTGWDITLDLIEKVAHIEGSKISKEPKKWYKDQFDEEVNYSNLIERLAPTSNERRNLLKHYFEPTEGELEEGLKVPTNAHRAIAELIKKGYFKVIITTNFDRLLEIALQDIGVHPSVLSTEDSIIGAVPLVHSEVTILKVHGDYLDTRIKNTDSELANYEPYLKEFLDQVFDEFGLITCGWSGDWDIALRDRINGTPNRRFSSFFTYLGEPSQQLSILANNRAGQLIEIENGDTFFNEIKEKVFAIETFSQSDPVSKEILIARLKKYLSEDKYQIQLHDLINNELETFKKKFFEYFKSKNPMEEVDSETLERTLSHLENLTENLIAIVSLGAYWSNEKNIEFFLNAIKSISNLEVNFNGQAYVIWRNIQIYPAILCMYSFGISSMVKSRYSSIKKLFSLKVKGVSDKENLALINIEPSNCFSQNEIKRLEKYKNNYVPSSEHIYNVTYDLMRNVLPIDDRFEKIFDIYEYLISLNYAFEDSEEYNFKWYPFGKFAYKRNRSYSYTHILDFLEEIEKMGNESEIIKSGMFDGKFENFQKAKLELDKFLSELHV